MISHWKVPGNVRRDGSGETIYKQMPVVWTKENDKRQGGQGNDTKASGCRVH